MLSDAAKRHIVKVGYDPHYGARPLKRTIQRELETPIGRKILAGEINEGDTVDVGFDENRGELTFSVGEGCRHGVTSVAACCCSHLRSPKFSTIRSPRRWFATDGEPRLPMRSSSREYGRSGSRARPVAPVQLFSSNGDDGQEISNLAISNDDAHVVYVRGGDHDANWPAPLQPDPASSPQQPEMQVWAVVDWRRRAEAAR